MRRRWIIASLVLLLLVVAGGVAVNRAVNSAVDARYGPTHRFPPNAGDTFLSDDYALAVARQALARDGYPPAAWEPLEDRRSRAPDGRPDVYLVRNATDANRGFISFRKVGATQASDMRVVTVEQKEGWVTAQAYIGK